jgi:cytochrome c peroxidase
MTAKQIEGFNLFMGKAQCGTCHFAPLFNGLLPPLFDRSEVEVLNVPKTANLKTPVVDEDSGRYVSFPIRFNYKAFKTPTVRNAAKTAPYMHNGALATLDEVMTFYNRGGGHALGLNDGVQTLSDRPLHLSKIEMKKVISFIEALTDKYEWN